MCSARAQALTSDLLQKLAKTFHAEVGRITERFDGLLDLLLLGRDRRQFIHHLRWDREHAMKIPVQEVAELHFETADHDWASHLDDVSIGV